MCAGITEIASSVGSVLTGVATAVLAYAAYRALGTWRTQLKAQTRFDSAKRLLIAAHDLGQSFHGARSPLILGSEFPADYSDKPSTTPDERADAYLAVFGKRWEPVRLRAANIVGLLPEVKALLPAAVGRTAEELITRTLPKRRRLTPQFQTPE